MKYENISWVSQSWMDPILNSRKQIHKILWVLSFTMALSISSFGQCNNTGALPSDRPCSKDPLNQFDVSVSCASTQPSDVGAGGLYVISVEAGVNYKFTLTPNPGTTFVGQTGEMDLFSDESHTNLIATTGTAPNTTLETTVLNYTADSNTDLFLAVWSHDCGSAWEPYELQVDCTTCNITCIDKVKVDANSDGCVTAASTFSAPTSSGPCGDIIITDDGGTGAMIDNSTNLVSIMPGLETGDYTIQFAVMDCAGSLLQTPLCSTELIVKPSSGCNSSINTQFTDEFCSITLSPSMLLKTVCAPSEDYTFFVDGVPTTSLTEVGSHEVSVSYTPQSNSSISEPLCWGTINVEDKIGPTCSLSDTEYNFVCGFETATAIPTFTDCSGSVIANDVVQLSIGNCGEVDGITDGNNDLFDDLPITTMGVTIPVPTEADAVTLNDADFALEKVLVNIYSASDGQNTGAACEQFVYIFRPTNIEMPGSAFVTCGLETTPTALAALDPQLVPHYVNPIFGTNSDPSNDFTGTGVENASFTPTMVDDNGNPQFVAIAGQDHSVCAFTVTFDETQATSPCGMTTKFVRRYTVLDCCSNVIVLDDESQYIETVDNVAPVFSDCPATGELGSISNPRIETINESNTCATIVDFTAIRPTATDDCSDETLSPITYNVTFFLVADDFSGTGTIEAIGMTPSLKKGSYRAEVVATDDCGNISGSCLIYLRVDDSVAPSVQCTGAAISVDSNGNADVCANIRANANDNCGTIASLEVKLMEQDDNTFASCINVNCTDAVDDGTGLLVFNLVYRATDECGNSNISMCPAELQIKTAPQFNCPSDVTVECSAYSNTANYGDPTIGGLCGRMFTTDFTDTPGLNSCAGTGTIVRTHTLSLNTTVVATCEQIITLEDTIDPAFDNSPADVSVECSNLPDGSLVTASDECSSATVSFDDVRTDGACTDSYIITRTFTATDECGNEANFVQTITVEDTTNPEIMTILADIMVGCNNVPVANTTAIVATDNCDTDVAITVSDSDPVSGDNCPNNDSFIRTFTATDNCGNSSTVSQMITIQPNPIQVTPAPNATLMCTELENYTFTPPTVIEDITCVGTNPVIIGPIITQTTLANGDIRLVGTFTVSDDCNISVEVSTTILFENCCSNVTVTGVTSTCETDGNNTLPVTVVIDQNSDIDVAALTFTATNMADDSDIVTSQGSNVLILDKFKVYTITVSATNTDVILCNPPINTFGCFVSRISGRIFNEEFIPLEEVEVELMNTEIPMSMTNVKGEYSFEDLAEQSYTIEAHKEKDPFNGISTFDLVVMAQHVLGIQDLSSPYKLIAADINMDETIDVLDMLELRQLILYAIDDFSVNTSWRFVNANYIFPDAKNPWLETIPELHNLEAPRTDVEHNFIAVKIGDLDCSAETKSNATDSNVAPRENKTLVLETEHQTVKAGMTFNVALQPNQDVSLSALQFTLDFDPSLATLVSVTSTVLHENDMAINEKFAQEGQVPFVWYSQQDVSLDSDQSITLTFEAKRDVDLENLLDINSSLTKAAAYSSEGVAYQLSFELLDELDSSAKYTLYQNQPNPFQAETVIGFDVAQDEDVQLTIFNLEGKMLYTAEFNAQAGYNSVVISKEELQTTGVLFYQLDAADYTTTKKMIILE